MLARRVIPTVLVRGSVAYKGPGFGDECTRSVGSALSICRTHAQRGVDELMIFDIAATPERRGPDLDMISALAAGCFTPITVGGGVRTIDDINRLLRAGADKVAICSAARENPDFVEFAAQRFGTQAIVQVVEHDASEDKDEHDVPVYVVSAWAGEIVVQCRGRDGKMTGYDMHIAAEIEREFEVPIIVSGGCSGPQDMLRAFQAGMSGCAAGALFQFTDTTPRDCARWLHKQGIEVRCS